MRPQAGIQQPADRFTPVRKPRADQRVNLNQDAYRHPNMNSQSRLTWRQIRRQIGNRLCVTHDAAVRRAEVAAMTEFNPLLHLQPVNFRQGEHEPVAWDPADPENQPQSRLIVA